MLRYILLVQLFLSGAFAHGIGGDHIHFLNSFHAIDFILLIIGSVGLYFLYRKLDKGSY